MIKRNAHNEQRKQQNSTDGIAGESKLQRQRSYLKSKVAKKLQTLDSESNKNEKFIAIDSSGNSSFDVGSENRSEEDSFSSSSSSFE